MQDLYIKKFYNELCENLEGNYKIILQPNRNLTEKWIEYDKVEWKIEEPMEELVTELVKNDVLSFEEKILKLYEFICLNYIYDDNVLYFFKRDASDLNNIKYIAVDWYGRIVGETWIKNRQNHNRRVCYEFARFYAQAINKLIKADSNIETEACMVGDIENLHYVVGLTGKEYSAILDLDDFNSIKDLTRVKLGLTIKGIKIFRDESGLLTNAIEKYNQNRLDELNEIENAEKAIKEKSLIEFFKKVAEILREYNIDSQGFCEYLRSFIEKEEIEIEKIWKEVKGEQEKRYSRCLLFEYNSNTYLLDSVDKTIEEVNREKIDRDKFVFNPEENEYPYYGG